MSSQLDVPRLFSDLALSQQLEHAEGTLNAEWVDARARLEPDSGAAWTSVGGTKVMFDGVGSPVTQTFGLGVFDPPTPEALGEIERFLQSRGADPMHEVSPLADSALWPLLASRGYRPIEFTSVLYRTIGPDAEWQRPRDAHVTARRSTREESEQWADIAARGWGDTPELMDFLRSFGRIMANRPSALMFFAEIGGEAVATGSLGIVGPVAVLAGASTVPAHRGQGAQLALLDARLRYAVDQGCTIAMMGALPGSPSQRNAERQGFRIAYTRVKWHLPTAAPR
jgi:GNAT superfamily N-acetyltransferase